MIELDFAGRDGEKVDSAEDGRFGPGPAEVGEGVEELDRSLAHEL